MPEPRILIIGGSTRAAADSVRRAGGHPICADLFADLDLRMTAQVVPARQYPDSLSDDVANVRADGWFYCGAMENHPEVLEQMLASNASYGPLLGTPPNALRKIRDPQWLATILQAVGLKSLEVADSSAPPAPDGTWLQKPIASAGGRRIRIWDVDAARIPLCERHYFQKVASGLAMSALFRAESDQMILLGASCEIDSHTASQAPTRFSYCGSYGPWSVHDRNRSSVRQTLQAIADALYANERGLRGLIGLDFRLCGDEVWLTEVNPRYTASVEVLELATGRSLLSDEIARCSNVNEAASQHGIGPTPDAGFKAVLTPSIVAKQILYADQQLVAPDLSRFARNADPWSVPIVADIPNPGSTVEAGWPICTVMASGNDFDATNDILQKRLNQVRSILGDPRHKSYGSPE